MVVVVVVVLYADDALTVGYALWQNAMRNLHMGCLNVRRHGSFAAKYVYLVVGEVSSALGQLRRRRCR